MMKKLVALIAFMPLVAFAGGEIKEVCTKEIKKGKEVEVCKKIKVHKKLDGTAPPAKK